MATFGFIRRIARDRAIVLVSSCLVLGALGFYFARPSQRTATLRLSAGSARGQRHAMAEILRAEAVAHRVKLVLVPTSGSEDALDRLEAGQIDLAMIQGGLALETGGAVRQVAALHVEPLHLMVKGNLHGDVSKSLDALRGRSVNLGPPGSGTRVTATEVCRFAGLEPDADFRATRLSYEQLEAATDGRQLPDAVFMVSLLPSPIVKRLVSRHGYRLVAMPFAEAFSLSSAEPPEAATTTATGGRLPSRRDHVTEVVIPPYTYGVRPAVPDERVRTLGLRMLLVARRDADPEAVARLLETVFTTSFSQLAHPPLSTTLLDLPPELTVHPGTLVFQERSKPLITGDVIDAFEKELSIAGALLGAAFFFWQWLKSRYRRLRESGFEHYILRVAEIEEKALRLELGETLDLPGLLALQDELGRIKGDAIARFAEGELEGEDLLSGFLAQASDARDHLTRMILHRRDDLERQARKQKREAALLWREALDGHGHPADLPAGPDSGATETPREIAPLPLS